MILAYVEILFPSKGSGPVPNPGWENMECELNEGDIRNRLNNFSQKWYFNKNKSNYVHLTGAQKQCSTDDTTLGSSNGYQYDNFSFVYTGLIINDYPGNEINAIGHVTVHELAHQFIDDLNCPDPPNPGPGHCTNNAFTPPNDSEPCVMQKYIQDPPNDKVRFCIEHIYSNSNICFDSSIRNKKDDL